MSEKSWRIYSNCVTIVCVVFLCCSEQHFTEVMLGEEFLGLSLQQVCGLISSDKLTVSTEEKVAVISVSHPQPLSYQSLFIVIYLIEFNFHSKNYT